MRVVAGTEVFGVEVGPRFECAHWHGPTDVVALKFPCCGTFWCCWDCHEALAGHPAQRWSETDQDEEAILCGACGHRLTIREYLEGESQCPNCGHGFNPGCRSHRHLYFDF
ncbi:MAG: hypothetical protein JST12_15655 [Armatimonadetes bacterium]|nr:hypothetical protein [Armatimonadota bacterium]